jgi:hypothetical protein
MMAFLVTTYPAAARADLPAEPEPEWEVGLTAYIWASGMNGDIGVKGVQPVNVDMSFGDIFDHLKFAGMASIQARHDRFVIAGDIQYVSLGASKDLKIRDVSFVEGDLDTSTFVASALAGYRLTGRSRTTLDLMAGGRINSVSTSIRLSGPLRTATAHDTKTWIDPIIGAHASVPLSSQTSLAAYGDVGGFGVSSDLTWQLLGVVQYDFNDRWRASVGWRHYAVDYHKDAFLYDVSLSGPIIGIRYSF